jgi:molecular chaperone DnaK (HSP70)
VLQGERDFVRDNKSLGNFRLDGIPPAPRGSPKIEVKFDIDANCILSVTATDKGSGKKADIKITGASTLAAEDVERMVRDAEMFAEEDKVKREAIDAKNQGDALVYQTRKQLSEFGEKIPKQLKDRVEEKLKELENAINSEDINKIKSTTDALQREVVEIGQAIYGQQETSSGPQDTTSDNTRRESSYDEVIDADVDEKKP